MRSDGNSYYYYFPEFLISIFNRNLRLRAVGPRLSKPLCGLVTSSLCVRACVWQSCACRSNVVTWRSLKSCANCSNWMPPTERKPTPCCVSPRTRRPPRSQADPPARRPGLPAGTIRAPGRPRRAGTAGTRRPGQEWSDAIRSAEPSAPFARSSHGRSSRSQHLSQPPREKDAHSVLALYRLPWVLKRRDRRTAKLMIRFICLLKHRALSRSVLTSPSYTHRALSCSQNIHVY